MFGFGRRQPPADAAPSAQVVPRGYERQTVLVALPDVAPIRRLDALQTAIADGLNGRNAAVVGHDRGAPERTLTGAVAGTAAPVTVSIARVKGLDSAVPLPTQEYADALGHSEMVDPRAAMLWDRAMRL